MSDTLSPHNHSRPAAAILWPFVSERTGWIIHHHGVFQGYYHYHHYGGDRDARERSKDSPHDQARIDVCRQYDHAASDPDDPTRPLGFFGPMVRRVFARQPGHMELSETAEC